MANESIGEHSIPSRLKVGLKPRAKRVRVGLIQIEIFHQVDRTLARAVHVFSNAPTIQSYGQQIVSDQTGR